MGCPLKRCLKRKERGISLTEYKGSEREAGQQRHPKKADKIGDVHGVAGKAVNAVSVESAFIRRGEGLYCEKEGIEDNPCIC